MKNVKDFINSTLYVGEPVEKEIKRILNTPKKKIIITGGRGIGKSVVLTSLENKGLGSKEQTIYTNPEGIITISKEPNDIYDNNVFNYYQELIFTTNILHYIRTNYPEIFEKYFKKDSDLVHTLTDDFFIQLNRSYYEFTTIDCRYGIKELSSDILNRFRQIMEIEKLNIAIDGFDKMNGSSEYMQKINEEYFDMFNKVILTADDTNLNTRRLNNKGYSVRKISYGKNKNVLRKIISHRGKLSNGNKYNELFTSDMFIEKLIQLNGDIDMTLNVLCRVKELIDWYGGTHTIEEILDEAIKEATEEIKGFEKRYSKPTLYL